MISAPEFEISPLYNNSYYQDEYTQYGGGLSLDVAKFGNWWAYPLVLSGSYLQTNGTNYMGQGITNNVALINSGLYWKFWKRAALLGGFQMVKNECNAIDATGYLLNPNITEMNIAGGLEYKIGETSVLTGTVGTIKSSKTGITAKPAMIGDYNDLQLDLMMTVKF